MRHARSIALFVVFAAVVLVVDAVACPTCKDGLAAADSQGANVARGYFYSILLMLAMPFTLAGCFGMYIWREYRRQQLAGGPDAVVRQVLEQQAKAAVAPSRAPVTAGSHAFGSHPLGSNSLGSDAC